MENSIAEIAKRAYEEFYHFHIERNSYMEDGGIFSVVVSYPLGGCGILPGDKRILECARCGCRFVNADPVRSRHDGRTVICCHCGEREMEESAADRGDVLEPCGAYNGPVYWGVMREEKKDKNKEY